MSILAFKDRPETRRGREAELAISNYLQQHGWYILPAYDYAGPDRDKAPALINGTEGLIVPDLLGAKAGSVNWFEVKRKGSVSRGWTGIPLKHYLHYQRVAEVTGAKVWLVFVHDAEDEVRIGEVGALDDQACGHPGIGSNGRTVRIYKGNEMSPGGMAFFCWECLRPIDRASSVLAAQP